MSRHPNGPIYPEADEALRALGFRLWSAKPAAPRWVKSLHAGATVWHAFDCDCESTLSVYVNVFLFRDGRMDVELYDQSRSAINEKRKVRDLAEVLAVVAEFEERAAPLVGELDRQLAEYCAAAKPGWDRLAAQRAAR